MASSPRFALWLASFAFLTLMGNSAAQVSDARKPSAKFKVKLPVLLSANPFKADPKDDELRKLLKARYNEAVNEAREYYGLVQLANRSAIELDSDEDGRYRMLQRVVQAGLELCDKPAEKIALLTKYLEATKEDEKRIQTKYDVGRAPIGDLHRARYERLGAEIQFLRAKREAAKAKDK